MNRYLLLLLALLLASAAQAQSAPKPHHARYAVHYGILKLGEMERRLVSLGEGRYRLETDVHTTGLASAFRDDRFRESSTWALVGGKPRPERYDYHFTRNDREVVEQVIFDWEGMRFTSLRDGEESVLELPEGAQDKLSYQMALLADLRAGASEFFYQVADRGDVRHMRYRVLGEESVRTPWGHVQAIMLERVTANRERETTIWTAPALDYMVVKLVQVEDGHKSTATLLEASLDGEPLNIAEHDPEDVIWTSD